MQEVPDMERMDAPCTANAWPMHHVYFNGEAFPGTMGIHGNSALKSHGRQRMRLSSDL